MSSTNLEEISRLLMRINEITSSPFCSSELTQLRKLAQQASKTEEEMNQVGMFQKRGLKKTLEQIQQDLNESEEKCLKCIYDVIVRELKPSLDRQIQSLSAILPQTANILQNLRLPLTSELSSLTTFFNDFDSLQNKVKGESLELCNGLLRDNQEIINNYLSLISFDSTDIKNSNSLTKDSLNVMKLENLLETILSLRKEKQYINSQLSSSTEFVQQKLLSMYHELTSALQDASNLVSSSEYEGISGFLAQIENANTMEQLNEINAKISIYFNKLSSILKSEITRYRTEGNNVTQQVRTLFPTLSDKWMPLPPEVSITSASVNELTNLISQMQSWKKNILDGIKQIATFDELSQVTEAALHEGLAIPNTLLVNAKENSLNVQSAIDIEEGMKRLRNYHTYYSQFLQILRDTISNNLTFEATDSDSAALISVKPPVVELKSDNPTDLLNYLRSVNIWKRKLINVLQEARHAINDTIATLNQLTQKGIDKFPSDFQSELKTLYDNMASETDVQTLLLYRRSYTTLYKQFVRSIAGYIKDYLKDVTIIELLDSDNQIPRPPFIEDASELELSELLERIEAVEEWKRNVLNYLKNKIENLNFPMIPGDVPVDLRKEKNDLLAQLSGTAATRNSIATFKSYFKFLETINSSKDIMIEETMKQIKLVEKIDQSSLKHFKEVVGSAINFEFPTDLEALDYAELMELWFRVGNYNKKKVELVLLKCKDLLSGWKKQYKSLPPQYLNIFNPLFLIFDQAISELNQSTDTEETLNSYDFYLRSATNKALEGLEKLKAFFYNKVTVSLPRIVEAIGEVSPEIHKVYNFLESVISSKDQSLESVNRLIIETIHDYEYVLIAKLMELLTVSSKNLLRKITELQSNGINVHNLIGEQLEVFTQLIQADTSDMMSIEMITQSFVELDKIMKNEILQKSLFETVDKISVIAARTLDLVTALGWKNAQQELMPNVVRIKNARAAITFWSFDLISNSTIESIRASKLLIESIKVLEKKNYEEFINQIENDPGLPYYQSIDAVFKFHLDECSQEIFPMKELIQSREKIVTIQDLNDMYDLITQISKLKTQWREKLPEISKWHRILFLFISDYRPTRIEEEKIAFLANSKRDIEDSFNYAPMIQYLTSAVQYYVSKR